MATVGSLVCLSNLPFSSQSLKRFHVTRLSPSPTTFTMKTSFSSSKTLSTCLPIHPHSVIPTPKRSTSRVFAAKGYKMKTHKASAKRFRVTGRGKIVRRRAGKQHLLAKKNNKRKLRLSKIVPCPLCKKFVSKGDEVRCSVQVCRHAYHRTCVTLKNGFLKEFKCPQHTCFICNRKNHWRCVRCFMAFHVKCSPWPDDVIFLANRPGRAICWRHPSDWRLDKQHADPTSDLEDVFHRLPLPYVEEEYEIGSIVNDVLENKTEPAPYIHIKRNIYLVKRKRDGADTNVGCTNCNANSDCSENCECRGLSLSCTKACHCSEICTNRPFRKEKKIKVVKTDLCGWGAVALESIEKGCFVVEYVGEVIDDALCEQRLWDMKRRGDQKFYMCEIRKDFTIDATFKGNFSRFLNHSCDPNCKLEKWQVDGETRVGVFALRPIQTGEFLTYDYRFVQFGPVVKCYCGASNCRGFIGSRKKTSQTSFSNSVWGCKKMRTHKNIRKKKMIFASD